METFYSNSLIGTICTTPFWRQKRGQEKQTNINAKTNALPLFKTTLGDTLSLVHLGGVTSGFERVAGSGEGLEVCTVLLVGLIQH